MRRVTAAEVPASIHMPDNAHLFEGVLCLGLREVPRPLELIHLAILMHIIIIIIIYSYTP